MNISLLSVNNHVSHSLHVSSTCCCSIPAITTLTFAPHHNTSDQIELSKYYLHVDRVLGGSGGRVIVGVRVVDLLPAIARAGPPTPGLGLGPQVRVVRQSGDAAIHAVRGKCMVKVRLKCWLVRLAKLNKNTENAKIFSKGASSFN